MWRAAVTVAECMTWKPLDTLERTSVQPVLVVAPRGGFQGGPDDRVSAGCYVGIDTVQDPARRPALWMPIPEVQEQKSEGK